MIIFSQKQKPPPKNTVQFGVVEKHIYAHVLHVLPSSLVEDCFCLNIQHC